MLEIWWPETQSLASQSRQSDRVDSTYINVCYCLTMTGLSTKYSGYPEKGQVLPLGSREEKRAAELKFQV